MYSSTALLLFATVSPVSAVFRGLNFGANLPSGACRSQADYTREFRTIKSNPPHFDTVRLFASSDCNQLASAVPAALATGVKILVGIWTQDDTHFGNEKGALLNVLQAYPNWADWMVGISVGSEDLYRNEAPAWKIAQKIYDVRGMVRAKGVQAPVGHVDTWTAWVDRSNINVTQAVDFVGTDGYPYWQGATMMQAAEVFWNSVQDVQNVVASVKPGTPVWVTETGWPVAGPKNGEATASISNAQTFWKAVACNSLGKINIFWFCYSEQGSSPDFSLYGNNDQPLYNLQC